MSLNLPEVTNTPCNECPWRRNSAPGHLGPYSAQTWAEMAHGEGAIACHVTITGESWDDPGMRQCAGAATFRTNVLKLPRNPAVATSDEPDHERIFSSSAEFISHHERKSQ
jgi:hypothetical protein